MVIPNRLVPKPQEDAEPRENPLFQIKEEAEADDVYSPSSLDNDAWVRNTNHVRHTGVPYGALVRETKIPTSLLPSPPVN